MNFKRHRKESFNLFNFVRSPWVIWIGDSKYVVMSETREHGEWQDKKKERLYFPDNIIELLKSPTWELFCLGIFFLHEIKFPYHLL